MILGIALTEPIPQRRPLVAEIAQDGAGIIELIGQRHQDGVGRDLCEVRDIALLANPPRRLGRLESVAAFADDGGDGCAGRDSMSARVSAPPWSSAASCNSAAMTCVSLPSASMTSGATDNR